MKPIKNVIFLNKEIPDKIRRQVKWWDLYAKVMPILYLLIGAVVYYAGMAELENLLWVGFGVLIITAVLWWFWTVNVIGEISERTNKAENGIQEVLHDIKQIKELVKEIRNR